jgi:predicted nucleic acid-binding Zn ribbon protein
MLPFGVTIPATLPQRSEIPEGLTNYLVSVIYIKPNNTPCVICSLGFPDDDHLMAETRYILNELKERKNRGIVT